jgi:hypothetical protein
MRVDHVIGAQMKVDTESTTTQLQREEPKVTLSYDTTCQYGRNALNEP